MKNLIEHIERKEYVEANDVFLEAIGQIVERKLFEAKKMYAAKLSLKEAVRAKNITPETIAAAQKRFGKKVEAENRGEELPEDPARIYGIKQLLDRVVHGKRIVKRKRND
jgi:hypothetical protein